MPSNYQGEERRKHPSYGEDRRDHHAKPWTEIWLTPTALVILLGGLTWGVQLNLAVGHLTEDVAEIGTKYEVAGEEIDALSDQMLRTSLILEGIEKRLRKVEEGR